MWIEAKKGGESWLDNEISLLKRETNDALNSLISWITPEKWITKEPTINNWAVFFDYENMMWKYEIVIRKENGTYKVRIKKRVKLPNWKFWWQTQKNGKYETFDFSANSKEAFNRWLWSALDKVIGYNRDKLPSTWWKVYSLLNAWNPETKKTQNATETKRTINKWSTTVKRKQESAETKGMPKWLRLDHWTYVYTVQSWDNESVIKQKLSRYTPLSYLKYIPDGINWRNLGTIPDKKLLPWLEIPVPKKDSERIKTISNFKVSQKSALNEMKNNSVYWDEIKRLLRKYSENHIASVMTAYAKSETSPENSPNEVWNLALFRYEKGHQCASYGYHHVLWEGSGKKAFKNTWLSIWQSCSPKESWKLFLAFCIEKVKLAQKKENRDFTKFFDMKNVRRCAQWYNWVDVSNYSNKLKKNYDKAINS